MNLTHVLQHLTALESQDEGWLEFVGKLMERSIMQSEFQRLGQSLYNGLHDINPHLAVHIATTEADPFSDDDNIPAFCEKLYEIWVEQQLEDP